MGDLKKLAIIIGLSIFSTAGISQDTIAIAVADTNEREVKNPKKAAIFKS